MNHFSPLPALSQDLQVARDASKALAEKAQLELSKALDEMAVLRSDVLRLQAPDQRDKVRVVADDVDETCLQRELDRARGDLSRAEAAKMALENDLGKLQWHIYVGKRFVLRQCNQVPYFSMFR